VIYYWTDARQHGIYLFHIITKQTTADKTFLFQNISAKAGLCPLWRKRKKPFEVIYYYLYKTEQSHWLLWVAKNCDCFRKITPLPNLTRVLLFRGIKTYSESRIEMRNLDKSSQSLSSEQPCEPKSLDLALMIAGVEKIRSKNLPLRSTWRPHNSSFQRKKSVSDVGNLYALWWVILKSV